jgi:hypothetical protein
VRRAERGSPLPDGRGAGRGGKARAILAALLLVALLLIGVRIALRVRECRTGAAYYDSLRAHVRE